MEGIHVAIAAEQLTEWMGFPITNSFLMSIVVLAVVLVLALAVQVSIRLNPGKFQVALETVFGGYYDFIKENLDNDKQTADKFFPLLMTIVLFIFIANFLEFIPGVESIVVGEGEHAVPLFRSLNADLNTTIALALISFFVIEISGVRRFGVRYFSRFVNFHSVMGFFVGLIELISELIRLVSFSFRLFGNIFAGGILIGVLTFFVPYILPAPFMVFEMFVGLLQGVVFSLLTLFFVKMALTKAEH
jgi:F-type H+-transporting ATPase subunit a